MRIPDRCPPNRGKPRPPVGALLRRASSKAAALLQQGDHISDSLGVGLVGFELVEELHKIALSLALSSASRSFSLFNPAQISANYNNSVRPVQNRCAAFKRRLSYLAALTGAGGHRLLAPPWPKAKT